MPEILEKCVADLVAKGKSRSSAFAICTASLQKAGKLGENMASKIKKFFVPIPEVSLDEKALSQENTKNLHIQLLKKGSYKHPWWGILRFDEAFFDKLIRNFDSNVPQESIAFDFKHQPDWGASAWVKKVYKDPNTGELMGEVELTPKGKESIANKEFKYFSSEYTDNYVEYNFEDVINEKGEKVGEKEIKVDMGPALLGGGLTNRPFLKGMKPLFLSEDGDMVELEELTEQKEENDEMKKTLEDLKKEQSALADKVKELEANSSETAKAELDNVKTALSEVVAEIKTLSENAKADQDTQKAKELGEAAQKKVAEKEKELEEAKKKLSETTQQLEDNGAVIKKLSDDVKSLTDSVKTLMKSNQELQDQKYELSIEKKIDDFKKLGAFPSTIETIKPFLLSEEGKTFSVKLSEKDESGKETGTKTISLAEIIESVLRSIPEEYRLSLDEKSSSVFTPEGTHNKELSEEDVQKYADENKLSYDEALVHFSKLGKI